MWTAFWQAGGDAMIEEWKSIDGIEGFYEVSNLGRVRSTTRTRLVKNRYGGFSPRTDAGKILATYDNGNGYAYISLKLGRKRKNYYVHRLVASSFLPTPTIENAVVDHKDHNRMNNCASNLQWVTQKENVNRSAHLMRHPKKKCKQSSTGEKYVIAKKGKFVVDIRQANVHRTFAAKSDAVSFRNEVIERAGI